MSNLDLQEVKKTGGNLKMVDSGLVTCNEVEQRRECVYFGTCTTSKARACYAELLLPMRRQTSNDGEKNHKHTRTPPRGIIRLGTYIEFTERLWEEFKSGRGDYDCGEHVWERPDFPTRFYFLITRGLSDIGFYEKVLADPYCLNVQVSTDIETALEDLIMPDRTKLQWFAKQPKAQFRFKTTRDNAHLFIKLATDLGIPWERVLETPLRLPKQPHAYGTETYLEKAGQDPRGFARCNTSCGDCVKENGALWCATRPVVWANLKRPVPVRHTQPQMKSWEQQLLDIQWKRDAARCMSAHGGECSVREAYAWFLKEYPVLEFGKPNWQFKVRVGLQRAGTSHPTKRSVWVVRPELRDQAKAEVLLTEF